MNAEKNSKKCFNDTNFDDSIILCCIYSISYLETEKIENISFA